MKLHLLALLAAAAPVWAQTPATPTEQILQRNLNQAERIEQGQHSGSLTVREAGRLQRAEAQVDRIEARAYGDGSLSPREQARITAAQNQASRAIAFEKHDAQTGDPTTASAQRMAAGVQRGANQEARTLAGVQQGQVSNTELARIEQGQARLAQRQAHAAADGRVGPRESARIQGSANAQGARIHRLRHGTAG
jgi:hypothetical protein